jgi:hypothetical protein
MRPFWGRCHHFEATCRNRLFSALFAEACGGCEFAVESHLFELLGRVRPDPIPINFGEEPLQGHEKLLGCQIGYRLLRMNEM